MMASFILGMVGVFIGYGIARVKFKEELATEKMVWFMKGYRRAEEDLNANEGEW